MFMFVEASAFLPPNDLLFRDGLTARIELSLDRAPSVTRETAGEFALDS